MPEFVSAGSRGCGDGELFHLFDGEYDGLFGKCSRYVELTDIQDGSRNPEQELTTLEPTDLTGEF